MIHRFPLFVHIWRITDNKGLYCILNVSFSITFQKGFQKQKLLVAYISEMSKFESSSGQKTILVCVDASQHSAQAFNWYCKNFYRDNDLLALTYIYEQPETPAFDPDNSEYQRRVTNVLNRSKSITRTFQEACAQRHIKSCVFIEEKLDSVGNTICRMARENGASSIVMGSRGMGLIKRTVVGSISDYVIHHAHIPVLIVPPPKEDKK